MKVLGLMCDGQNKGMQNFLREQKEQIHSINIVAEVTSFLQIFYHSQSFNSNTIKLLHQILQTLNEIGVGNYANQLVIYDWQILSVINHILQIDISNINAPVGRWVKMKATDGDDMESYPWFYQNNQNRLPPVVYQDLRKQALNLKSSAIELLRSMLEETSLSTKELATQLSRGLDVEALHGTLVDFYQLRSDRDLIKDEYDDNAERALFNTYHVLIQLNYYGIPMKTLGQYTIILI